MQTTSHDRGPISAPSWALLGLEPVRAVLEYASMRWMDKSGLPAGDGHPVVCFPGLVADEWAIRPLTRFCAGLGYRAHDWGRGFNTGPQGEPDAWLDALAEEVVARSAPEQETISLVGWSLGGLYAREVAKRLPGRVRQVISIGTPLAATAEQTNAALVYRVLNGQPARVDPALSRLIRAAPPVPTTAIYSRSDGVVPWQACLQTGRRGDTENIEVAGSHCGLVCNAQVFEILADRLSQPQGAWRRYAPAAQASLQHTA